MHTKALIVSGTGNGIRSASVGTTFQAVKPSLRLRSDKCIGIQHSPPELTA
jgi:hypothetical protein